MISLIKPLPGKLVSQITLRQVPTTGTNYYGIAIIMAERRVYARRYLAREEEERVFPAWLPPVIAMQELLSQFFSQGYRTTLGPEPMTAWERRACRLARGQHQPPLFPMQ